MDLSRKTKIASQKSKHLPPLQENQKTLRQTTVFNMFKSTTKLKIEDEDDNISSEGSQILDQDNNNLQERKQKRDKNDFYQSDRDKRNILHRACLDQQVTLIQDIISEFRSVLEASEMILEDIDENIKNYVNEKDTFGCTPLQICCFLQPTIKDEKSQKKCQECLCELIKYGANVNTMNPQTLWSPIHWCCHYGLTECVELLLHKGAITFYPDFRGNYPIDLAGRQSHKTVVEILIKSLIHQLKDFERLKNDPLSPQGMKETARWLSTPLLRVKMLYWALNFYLEMKFIKDLIEIPRTYYLAPIASEFQRTPLHAACQSGYYTAIEFLLDYQIKWYDNEDVVKLTNYLFKPTIFNNQVFQILLDEGRKYRTNFHNDILKIADWEIKFLKNHQSNKNIKIQRKNLIQIRRGVQLQPVNVQESEQTLVEIVDIDTQDKYGNTALHLASLKGHPKIVQLLLQFGASMEIENKELFKARELTRSQQVAKVYSDMLQQLNQKTIEQINFYILSAIKELIIKKNLKRDFQVKTNNLLARVGDPAYQEQLKKLFQVSNKMFVPDFVLKAKIQGFKQVPGSLQFYELLQQDNTEIQRLNFQISLLTNAKFQVYLMNSNFEPGVIYIMISHHEENLEIQAQIMNLQAKLMDSYDLEPFLIQNQTFFEPFRSRQRQEIIQSHVKRIMNLSELENKKVIATHYRMHTFGGIQKIKEQWVDKVRWYWPQPLCQILDFIRTEQQNFSSVTVLRLYFGEKISFFFAWKSYLTCILVTIAIPGLILQIYILITNDFNPAILPFWVFLVCLWSTIQVEYWKRVTSELNARWGSLDLIDQKDTTIRDSFSGDEEIDEATGELTKHEKSFETLWKFIISAPILLFFVGLCIVIFIGIDYLKKQYAASDIIIGTVLGALQGVGITVLNMIYTTIAKWFAQIENHKFNESYESSMIYKNIMFKFINSYLSIFYAAFIKTDSTLESIFQLMFPVLIVKQVNYMVLEVFLPQIIYKNKEKQYFDKQSEIIQKQRQVKLPQNQRYVDQCEELWNFAYKESIPSGSRAVLKIDPYQSKLTENIDVDAVELNSLKLDFESTLSHFTEGMIDIGYITLFAAAFPIGPFLSLLANVLEIKMKIFSFLYVYKRPQTERCNGIGEWLNVMEIMSLVSVFSNFALLYIKSRTQTIDAIQFSQADQNPLFTKEDSDTQPWIFIFLVIVVIGIKIFFQIIIPDRPVWVVQEIEQMKVKELKQGGSTEQLNIVQSKLLEVTALVEKARRIRNEQNQKIQKTQEALDGEIQKYQNGIEQQNMIMENEKKLKEKKDQLLATIGKVVFDNNQDFLQVMNAIMKDKYQLIENHLIQQRIGQINEVRQHFFFICQECAITEAIYECEQCDESLCAQCYISIHSMMKGQKHSVILTKAISFYNPEDLIQMKVKRRPNQKSKVSKTQKQKYREAQASKFNRWRKFQYFVFPTNEQSEKYKSLIQFFKLFYQEYIEDYDFQENSLQISMGKLFKYKKIPETNQFESTDSKGIGKILNLDGFNIEDKLWLNRIAFLVFKKLKYLAKFEDFYKICMKLQKGLLDQRIITLIDIIDINEDGNISHHEIQNIFVASFIQDTLEEVKLDDVLRKLFLKKKDYYSKREAAAHFTESMDKPIIKQFIQCLLQDS